MPPRAGFLTTRFGGLLEALPPPTGLSGVGDTSSFGFVGVVNVPPADDGPTTVPSRPSALTRARQ